MRKTKSTIGATGTEESDFTRNIHDVKDALDPAEDADYGSGDEERNNEILPEAFRRIEQRRNIDDSEGGEESQPKDAGGQDSASRVGGPENGEGGIEWKESEEEEFAIRYTWQ